VGNRPSLLGLIGIIEIGPGRGQLGPPVVLKSIGGLKGRARKGGVQLKGPRGKTKGFRPGAFDLGGPG